MGFWGDVKRDVGIKRVREVCENSGLYPGTRSENCEKCRHGAQANCVTGIVCLARTMSNGGYMVTLANYKCNHYSR